jgi:alpha-glucosidase
MLRRPDNLRFFLNLGGKQLVEDIKDYDKTLKRYDKRYGVKKRPSTNWTSPGAVRQYIRYERGLRFACDRGWVELQWIAVDCIRVRLRVENPEFIPPFSYSVSKVDWPPVPFEVIDHGSTLEIYSAGLTCRVSKQPFRIALETRPEGRLLCIDSEGMQWRDDGAVRLSVGLKTGETSYGMGERAAGLNLRGKKFSLWNTDASKYDRATDPLYYNIPFYLGVHNDGVHGIFWDNSWRGVADLGGTKSDELTFESEGGELRYYLFGGADVNTVLSRYTELTGRIKLPPLWSLGYQQSRFSYFPQKSVLELALALRHRGIPCDVIYLDIHYMDGFRVFTWDKERFPDLRQMIADLHVGGFKVVAILNPGVKVDPEYRVYKSGIAREIFLKYPDGAPAEGVVWSGTSNFPDFTNPAARAWWTEQCKVLLDLGVDGVWNDMGEPALFTPTQPITLPDYVHHNKDGLGGDHLENHNVYGMLMGRASLEALEKQRPGLRQFNVIRSGFAGAQRYAASWTGDSASTWDHLKLSLSMALNMGLSGAPITGSDIGGYRDDSNGELFTRWLQAACFMPFFRSHTDLGTQPQEPWSFGQPYEVINRLTIELRYRFLPYLYSVIAQCKEYGWPVIRPLFMAEPSNLALRGVDDCYLVGDALLVAPVVEQGAVQRSLYLPAGEWYDYWTNELLQGGRNITVTAPLERLPLFVRAGAVLPMWPEMQFTTEYAPESLTLRVYPGDFETVLYEDSGEGLDYERGDYRWIYITAGWEDSRFVINRRTAGRYTPPYKMIRLEVVGFDEEPTEVRVDRQGAPLWFYDDGLLELTIDNFSRIEILRKILPSDRTILRRPW